jgi:hypothetical protein
MRLYYLDESEGKDYYVRSAFGINAEVWNDVFSKIKEWRKHIKDTYLVPMHSELHAYELLHGKGLLKLENGVSKRLTIEEGASILQEGLQLIENIAHNFPKNIELINVALKKSDYSDADIVSLERMQNRIQTSTKNAGKYAFCIFDEGKEMQITKFYRKALRYNPIPSHYGGWDTGKFTKNIPPDHIVGNPAFRRSKDDYFLQAVDFVAHAVLKKREIPTSRITKFKMDEYFDILDECLNKSASRYDKQGIVGK